jgi:acetyl/propionyl-CoA carboxylase alpha subunit
MEVPTVTYFHIELSRHAVILAENLPAESYLDTGDRASFANGGGAIALHPSFGAERGDVTLMMEALGYAPLRVTGAEVERIRADLRLNALPRGHSNRS